MDDPTRFFFEPDSSEVRVFAVADGLGGHSSGEVASQFVLSGWLGRGWLGGGFGTVSWGDHPGRPQGSVRRLQWGSGLPGMGATWPAWS